MKKPNKIEKKVEIDDLIKIRKDIGTIKELVESIFDKVSDIFYKRNE